MMNADLEFYTKELLNKEILPQRAPRRNTETTEIKRYFISKSFWAKNFYHRTFTTELHRDNHGAHRD